MIVIRHVEKINDHFVEKVLKCSAKELAREIILDSILNIDGIVRYAEGMDGKDWENMTEKEQSEVIRHYNKYISRIMKIMGEA